MNSLLLLVEIVAFVALVAAPPILISRFLAGGERSDLSRLFAIPADLPWPRGVQEEEPVRWRTELIDGGPDAIDPASARMDPPREGSQPRYLGRPADAPRLEAG